MCKEVKFENRTIIFDEGEWSMLCEMFLEEAVEDWSGLSWDSYVEAQDSVFDDAKDYCDIHGQLDEDSIMTILERHCDPTEEVED